MCPKLSVTCPCS